MQASKPKKKKVQPKKQTSPRRRSSQSAPQCSWSLEAVSFTVSRPPLVEYLTCSWRNGRQGNAHFQHRLSIILLWTVTKFFGYNVMLCIVSNFRAVTWELKPFQEALGGSRPGSTVLPLHVCTLSLSRSFVHSRVFERLTSSSSETVLLQLFQRKKKRWNVAVNSLW